MKVAIIGGKVTPQNYQKVDKKINELIEEKGIYLFYILCGLRSKNEKLEPTLGSLWAYNNGAPVRWILQPTAASIIKAADYIIFLYDGQDTAVRKLIMQYKMTGKHGSVIYI